MRVVLDTNIFISGFFWHGPAEKILNLWKSGKFSLIISMDIISEIVKVLKDFKIKMSDIQRKQLIDIIIGMSLIVELTEKVDIVKDDPDDNKFIEASISGKADYIITQDKHLLKIKQFRNIKVLTPEEFLAILL